MRKSKGSEYRQSYNGQVAVSTDGSQLIVGARLTNAASDRRELVATVDAVPPALGRWLREFCAERCSAIRGLCKPGESPQATEMRNT
ncbi:hypothetical protein [Thiohalobacter sp.]|uniref:hypothetical protein n=1 Tax=Thiohalobacter sp. TaxID=2025948 RepID=UPI002605EAB3|nr:hypothetical protein [Thiohalobacter sp.]